MAGGGELRGGWREERDPGQIPVISKENSHESGDQAICEISQRGLCVGRPRTMRGCCEDVWDASMTGAIIFAPCVTVELCPYTINRGDIEHNNQLQSYCSMNVHRNRAEMSHNFLKRGFAS
jgi:hypothetical protein